MRRNTATAVGGICGGVVWGVRGSVRLYERAQRAMFHVFVVLDFVFFFFGNAILCTYQYMVL